MKTVSPKTPREKISILFLGTQMAVGGAQKVLFDQARWFEEHGHKVAAAFFYDKEGLHTRWMETKSFPIYDLEAYGQNSGAFRNFISLTRGLWMLWKLLRREKFDVIETFTPDSNLLALPLAWLAGVPVRIATHHGVIEGIPHWRERVHSLLVNLGIASALIAVSEMTRQNALSEGIRPGKITVVPNGIFPMNLSLMDKVNARREIGLAENDVFLLAVGRLVYLKGHEFLIRAMPAILDGFPNVKVGICGEGMLRPLLENLIQELGLSKAVKLFGTQEDISRYLAAADIFVLPSRSEGLPIALLEAMSAGLPVVATKVGGIGEVVIENERGLLIPPENSDAMAESILKLLSDPVARYRMGKAARAHVLQKYTVDSMCQKYLELMLSFC